RARRWLALAAATTLAFGSLTAASSAAAGTLARASATGTVVYVSPLGDDGNSGRTWWSPLRTLQHARDVVRAHTRDGDVTVKLLPGMYELSEPLRLDARDSGTDGHKVVWTAAVPELPTVVSGGTR